jgi:trehalose 6-phosphate phosphatase
VTGVPDPRTPEGRSGLAELIATPSRAVVAVDFDGTLAPIVARPMDARPAPGAIGALAAIAAVVGRCAVVSGRSATDVVELGGLDAVPGLVVFGHYGLERWSDGRLESPAEADGVDLVRSRLPGLLAAAAKGVHVEDKGHSLAVHSRPAADPAAALAALQPALAALAAETGLELVAGRHVLELRPAGTDKGLAVRRLVAEQDAACVVYLGDDLGDLPAYDAVASLRAEGISSVTVAVAGDDAPTELAARADVVLEGPTAVVQWLADLAAAIGHP